MLRGKRAEDGAAVQAVAGRILQGAKGFGHNDFKVDLARRAIGRALRQAAAGTPQPPAQKKIQ